MAISRRRFLIIASVVTMTVGGGLGYPYLHRKRRELLYAKHVAGIADPSPFDEQITTTLALFCGALFGHFLSGENLSEIVDLLDFSVMEDNGWRGEFRWLSSYVNDNAVKKGAQNFNNASSVQRENIVAVVMEEISPRESRVLATFSEHERNRRRMMKSTIPHLVRIYTHSGVPWRYRGYESWPGVPGETFDYTKPGPAYKC